MNNELYAPYVARPHAEYARALRREREARDMVDYSIEIGNVVGAQEWAQMAEEFQQLANHWYSQAFPDEPEVIGHNVFGYPVYAPAGEREEREGEYDDADERGELD